MITHRIYKISFKTPKLKRKQKISSILKYKLTQIFRSKKMKFLLKNKQPAFAWKRCWRKKILTSSKKNITKADFFWPKRRPKFRLKILKKLWKNHKCFEKTLKGYKLFFFNRNRLNRNQQQKPTVLHLNLNKGRFFEETGPKFRILGKRNWRKKTKARIHNSSKKKIFIYIAIIMNQKIYHTRAYKKKQTNAKHVELTANKKQFLFTQSQRKVFIQHSKRLFKVHHRAYGFKFKVYRSPSSFFLQRTRQIVFRWWPQNNSNYQNDLRHLKTYLYKQNRMNKKPQQANKHPYGKGLKSTVKQNTKRQKIKKLKPYNKFKRFKPKLVFLKSLVFFYKKKAFLVAPQHIYQKKKLKFYAKHKNLHFFQECFVKKNIRRKSIRDLQKLIILKWFLKHCWVKKRKFLKGLVKKFWF